jgi:ABC-type multidrug transport system ATPase subunit
VPDVRAGAGAITALIGPNNSGKTYTLESLRHALDETSRNEGTRIAGLECTEPGVLPRLLYLGNNSIHMGKVGQGVDPFVRKEKIGHPRDIPNYRPPMIAFLLEMLEYHFGAGFRTKFQQSSLPEQKKLLSRIALLSPLLLCRQDHPLVARLQDFLQGTLYLRRTRAVPHENFEFLLAYEGASPVPFGQWSDGQKLVFLALVCLELTDTDLVLFDEIENHLHPERISRFLGLLRAKPVQTILSTHNPHVMFSEFVDKVYFVEQLCQPMASPHDTLSFNKHTQTIIPQRRFTDIEEEFTRIEHLYRLFDHHDQKLLSLAGRLAAEVDRGLYTELVCAFAHPPLPASSKPGPDLQSSQLLAQLRKHPSAEPIRILDLGAGIGRIAQEVAKVPSTTPMEWICWEPEPAHRPALQNTLKSTNLTSRVIDSMDDVPDGSVSIALLANVLHELLPEQIGALLANATQKLVPNGTVIILDLYPLLSVEYYAVPYQEADLTDILASAGFTFETQTYASRGHLTTAYCIVAQPKRRASAEDIAGAVRAQWNIMKRRSLGFWARKRPVRSFDEYKSVLQHMTTVASISAYEARLWNAEDTARDAVTGGA